MSYHYDRTGERVEDDERTEKEQLDHVEEVRRILRECRRPPEEDAGR